MAGFRGKTIFYFLFVFFVLLLSSTSKLISQVCQTGSIGVSGPGCGCLGGCDLTAYGGPNCGSGVSGNCTAGYLYMSVSVNVPAGCTVQASANMQVRPGCTASGADGASSCGVGCSGSCDKLRVISSSNPSKPWQCGNSNATITDVETLTGAGTITVEGYANRADEIIVYAISYVSGGSACGASCGALSWDHLDLNGWMQEGVLYLFWRVWNERNMERYFIEISPDGEKFVPFSSVSARNEDYSEYTVKIENIAYDKVYVRILFRDFDGAITVYPSLFYFEKNFVHKEVYFQKAGEPIYIEGIPQHVTRLRLLDILGNVVWAESIAVNTYSMNIPVVSYAGLYLLVLENETGIVGTKRVVMVN